jgi:hypothetical protein
LEQRRGYWRFFLVTFREDLLQHMPGKKVLEAGLIVLMGFFVVISVAFFVFGSISMQQIAKCIRDAPPPGCERHVEYAFCRLAALIVSRERSR